MKQSLQEAMLTLIKQGKVGSQQALCQQLNEQGFKVNQSKISRLLRKMNVAKTRNAKGLIVYSLTKEPAPPKSSSSLQQLILNISHNENLILIQTSPGSASLIARMLDYQENQTTILGTLAGDNMIIVVPKSIQNIEKTLAEIKALLAKVY